MNRRFSLVIRWCLLAAMCVLIFVFSGFSADESSTQSGGIVDVVTKVFFHDYDSYPKPKQEAIESVLTVVIRKGAHFSEYALLCMLAFSAFVGLKKYLPRWLLAVLFSAAYACTDELHQMFVPGRAGMWQDVLLDTSGALVGGLVACFISMIIAAYRVLRDNPNSRK